MGRGAPSGILHHPGRVFWPLCSCAVMDTGSADPHPPPHPAGRSEGGTGMMEGPAQSAARVWGLFPFTNEVWEPSFWGRGRLHRRTDSSWNPGSDTFQPYGLPQSQPVCLCLHICSAGGLFRELNKITHTKH